MSEKDKVEDTSPDDILQRNSAEAGMIMVKRVGEAEFRPIQEVANEEAKGQKKLAEAMRAQYEPQQDKTD